MFENALHDALQAAHEAMCEEMSRKIFAEIGIDWVSQEAQCQQVAVEPIELTPAELDCTVINRWLQGVFDKAMEEAARKMISADAMKFARHAQIEAEVQEVQMDAPDKMRGLNEEPPVMPFERCVSLAQAECERQGGSAFFVFRNGEDYSYWIELSLESLLRKLQNWVPDELEQVAALFARHSGFWRREDSLLPSI